MRNSQIERAESKRRRQSVCRLVKTTHTRQHNEHRAAATAAACAVDRHASWRAATHRHSKRWWWRGGRHRYCRQRDGSAVLLVLVLLGAECGTQTAARSLLRVACTAHRSTAKQIKVGTTLVIVTIIIIITIITIITITTTTIITTTSKQAPHRLGFGARLPKRHSATRLEHALQHRVELHSQTHSHTQSNTQQRQTPLNHHRSTINNLENYGQGAHASSSTACTCGQASARDVAHLRLGD